MLIHLPRLLTQDQLAQCRVLLAESAWLDGRVTAGPQAAAAKHNSQLAETDPVARALGDLVIRALERHPLFLSATLAKQVYPPLFNRYEAGQSFGFHVDNAMRSVPGQPVRLRCDVSATLFLSEPDSYDGGELIVEDSYGAHRAKLPAGDLVLYPAGSLHRVTEVTRGVRLAAVFWVQSLVKDDGERTLLHELDGAIQALGADAAGHPALVRLTQAYHNLLRRWAEP